MALPGGSRPPGPRQVLAYLLFLVRYLPTGGMRTVKKNKAYLAGLDDSRGRGAGPRFRCHPPHDAPLSALRARLRSTSCAAIRSCSCRGRSSRSRASSPTGSASATCAPRFVASARPIPCAAAGNASVRRREVEPGEAARRAARRRPAPGRGVRRFAPRRVLARGRRRADRGVARRSSRRGRSPAIGKSSRRVRSRAEPALLSGYM